MSAIIRSLSNQSQTIDGVALPAWGTQTRDRSTAAIAAALAAKTIQVDIVADSLQNSAALRSTYQPTLLTATLYQTPSDAEAVFMHAAGTLASVLINLPLTPYDGQRIEYALDQTGTACTVTATGADDTSTTILGAPTALVANQAFAMRYRAVNPNNATLANHGTWFRVG